MLVDFSGSRWACAATRKRRSTSVSALHGWTELHTTGRWRSRSDCIWRRFGQTLMPILEGRAHHMSKHLVTMRSKTLLSRPWQEAIVQRSRRRKTTRGYNTGASRSQLWFTSTTRARRAIIADSAARNEGHECSRAEYGLWKRIEHGASRVLQSTLL